MLQPGCTLKRGPRVAAPTSTRSISKQAYLCRRSDRGIAARAAQAVAESATGGEVKRKVNLDMASVGGSGAAQGAASTVSTVLSSVPFAEARSWHARAAVTELLALRAVPRCACARVRCWWGRRIALSTRRHSRASCARRRRRATSSSAATLSAGRRRRNVGTLATLATANVARRQDSATLRSSAYGIRGTLPAHAHSQCPGNLACPAGGHPDSHKTKIICTIGPASDDLDTLRALAENGMDIARLNFTHRDHAWHAQTIQRIQDINRSGCDLVSSF